MLLMLFTCLSHGFFGVLSGVKMVFGHVLRGVWFSVVYK
jgi:hypothetical protein